MLSMHRGKWIFGTQSPLSKHKMAVVPFSPAYENVCSAWTFGIVGNDTEERINIFEDLEDLEP